MFSLLCITEAGQDKLSECDIAVNISDLLGTSAGGENQDTVLELLANLSENGQYKSR